MIEIECTKCGAVVARLSNGKFVIDTDQARALERDTHGNIHCVCNCGRKKIIRPETWWESPVANTRRSGRRIV